MPRWRKLATTALGEERREQFSGGLVRRPCCAAWSCEPTSSWPASRGGPRKVRTPSASLSHCRPSARGAPLLGTGRVGAVRRRARPGRPQAYQHKSVAAVVLRALEAWPGDSATWRVRGITDSDGVSKSTGQRWFAQFGVKPHIGPRHSSIQTAQRPLLNQGGAELHGTVAQSAGPSHRARRPQER